MAKRKHTGTVVIAILVAILLAVGVSGWLFWQSAQRVIGEAQQAGEYAAEAQQSVGQGDFKQALEKAQSSDFLRGKNARNWTANFDWMIKDANIAKILDGNYDNKPEDTGIFGGTPPSYDLEELAKRGMYVPEI